MTSNKIKASSEVADTLLLLVNNTRHSSVEEPEDKIIQMKLKTKATESKAALISYLNTHSFLLMSKSKALHSYCTLLINI